MQLSEGNDTRVRILDVAETLFAKRGFKSVTLRDIAVEVGIKHASLYYYAPGGKEQLFIEVMERNFRRHREGLTAAVESGGDNLREQIHAAGRWMVSQPPMNLVHMVESDLTLIDPKEASRLMFLAFDSMRLPIMRALEPAQKKGEIVVRDLSSAAMALVGLLQSVHGASTYITQERKMELAAELGDMLLFGWVPR